LLKVFSDTLHGQRPGLQLSLCTPATPFLECGDLSPLCIRGDLSPRSLLEIQPFTGCDRSQPAKSGDRSPHSKIRHSNIRAHETGLIENSGE
jgi:hypothetical protein